MRKVRTAPTAWVARSSTVSVTIAPSLPEGRTGPSYAGPICDSNFRQDGRPQPRLARSGGQNMTELEADESPIEAGVHAESGPRALTKLTFGVRMVAWTIVTTRSSA